MPCSRYVGAHDIAAFLLATPEGHVLINSVRYAVLAGCGRDTVGLGPRLRGRILSVYDEKDRFQPSCRATFEQAPRLHGRKELVVHTGLDHGLLYTPRPEWLDPVTEWIRAGPASP